MNNVKLIAILSLLASLLWIAGLGFTINSQFFQKPEPPPKAAAGSQSIDQDKDYHIVGLGDSLTRGIGDSSGKGYVGYLLDHLKEKSKQQIQLTNLAIGGQTSTGLASQLKQPEIQRQIKNANAVVMTIGGNDLFNGGQVMDDLSADSITKTRSAFLQRLDTIFQQIRSINPEATIFYIGLYNPFSDLSNSKETSDIVRKWNYYTAEEASKYKKTIVVPTYDLFEQNVNSYLYSDKFHPNNEGYKLIGERLASLIIFSGGGKAE